MQESNVIPFAPFAAQRRRVSRPVESRDKPYSGGGIDELWIGDPVRPSAVVIRLY